MTSREPRPIEPAILTEVSEMFLASPCDHEAVIRRMRILGLSKIECMKLFRNHGGVSLGKAKDIVHLSAAWADRYESDEAFHDAAEKALDIILQEERTAA